MFFFYSVVSRRRRRFQSRNQIRLFTASICSTAPHTSSIGSLECCFFFGSGRYSKVLTFSFLHISHFSGALLRWSEEKKREEKLLRASIEFIEWAVRGSLLCCIATCCVWGWIETLLFNSNWCFFFQLFMSVMITFNFHNTTPAERQLVPIPMYMYCTMCSVDGL